MQACARLGKSPASGRLFDKLLEEILFRGQQHGPKRLTAESMTSLIEAAAMVHHPVQEHVIDRWAVNCLNRCASHTFVGHIPLGNKEVKVQEHVMDRWAVNCLNRWASRLNPKP